MKTLFVFDLEDGSTIFVEAVSQEVAERMCRGKRWLTVRIADPEEGALWDHRKMLRQMGIEQ